MPLTKMTYPGGGGKPALLGLPINDYNVKITLQTHCFAFRGYKLLFINAVWC